MPSTPPLRLGLPPALLGVFLLLAGCSGEPVAEGSAIAIDQTTSNLTLPALLSANGTYGSCRGHVDGSAWSVAVSSTATLDNPALTVVLNNAACVLTLTALHTSGGVLTASPAIVLSATYPAAASAFGSPVQFYANARLNAVSFAANFSLLIPFSDDPRLGLGSNTAGFSVVVATSTGTSVPAPDYTLDVSGLIVKTDINNIVQTVTGSAGLTAGSSTGQAYAVVSSGGLNTYSALDAAYLAAVTSTMALAIPAAAFTLVGVDLTSTAVRTLILSNTLDGVASYEAFEITFHPAP